MKLNEISTKSPADFKKDDIKDQWKDMHKTFAELQYKMRAQEKYSLLLVLQGMDASGKDGVCKDVFRGINTGDVLIKSWKAPSAEELAHDFLWRIHKCTPAKGMIQVFNRSQYEDVLITRVHKWIDDKTAEQRMNAINNFEQLLLDNNTHIIKCYLHISFEEQEKRLLERKENPRKMWKHNDGDWEERKHWKTYMEYYEQAIEKSTQPWVIIPADDKDYRNYLVLQEVIKKLQGLDLQFPNLDN